MYFRFEVLGQVLLHGCLNHALTSKHHLCHAFDHRQAGDIAFEFGDARQDLAAENLVNLFQVFRLHLHAVAQVVGDVLTGQFRRDDTVDDVAGQRHIKLGEQAGRFLRIQDDHLFRDDDEEEGGLLLVGQDAGGGVDAVLDDIAVP